MKTFNNSFIVVYDPMDIIGESLEDLTAKELQQFIRVYTYRNKSEALMAYADKACMASYFIPDGTTEPEVRFLISLLAFQVYSYDLNPAISDFPESFWQKLRKVVTNNLQQECEHSGFDLDKIVNKYNL